MKTAKLSDVKNDLSRYVARVRRGERVRILVRGIAAADLVPVMESEVVAETDWPEVRELERQGLVRGRGRKVDDSSLDRPGPRVKGGDAVGALLQERARR